MQEEGISLFASKKFDAAIKCFTDAIGVGCIFRMQAPFSGA